MVAELANCGKTFLLKPLQTMFKAFSNPSNGKYAWIAAEDAAVIFLNDFRWTSEMIAWKQLLLLLEGQTVHLLSPKNHYASDITISSDAPIYATGKSRIVFRGRGNSTHSMQDDMMAARWIVFEFFHQIPVEKQKDVPQCHKCFAKLALTGKLLFCYSCIYSFTCYTCYTTRYSSC